GRPDPCWSDLRRTIPAVVEFAINHQSAADAGADGDVKHAPQSPARSDGCLGQRRAVLIVVDKHRQPKLSLEPPSHGETSPAGNLMGPDRATGFGIKRPAEADPDRLDSGGPRSVVAAFRERTRRSASLQQARREPFNLPPNTGCSFSSI